MSDELLQTKLFIPSLRPSLVPRTRLIKQLNRNKHSKLTLVSAPAGFGKTTLVVAWLAAAQAVNDTTDTTPLTPHLSCWLSLDENDDILPRFFTYFIAAIRTVIPEFGTNLLTTLKSAQPLNETAVTQTLLNQLADLTQFVTLILDDYHVITNPAIHDALTTLIEYLPPCIHLVITSREDPPLPLPRWRVRGQLTEIRADDLRFNRAEATDFFQHTMGLPLDEQTITSLENRTEGWAAGLQLAALSLHGQPNSAQQLATISGSDRHIADYLLTEVLYQQPPEIQQFLLQTAVLDRLCAPLCDALLEIQSPISNLQSQKILERLETTNLFLVPLDSQRRWYRYHHLFAELLRERVQRDMGKTAVCQLHQRAAHWYESQNLREEAIRHAFQAEDFEYAGQLVAGTAVDSLWNQGGATLIQQWAKVLPSSIIQTYPRIAILAAFAHLVVGDVQIVAEYLNMAANQPQVEAEWHLLEAIFLRNRGQVPQAIEFAQHALETLDPDQYILRTFAYLQLVSNYLELAELDEAEQVITTIRHHFDHIDISSQLQVLHMHGIIATIRANFHQAAAIYREGLNLPDAAAQPMAGTLYNGLGYLHFQWHEMDEAATYYEKANSWVERTGITDILFDTYVGQANLAIWHGEPQIALDIMARFKAFAQRSNLSEIIEMSNLYEAVYHLKAGQLETAVQWVNNSGLTASDKPTFKLAEHYKLFITTHISHSQQTGDTSQLPALGELAQQLLALFRQRDYIFEALDLLTWMTLLYDLQGEREKALDCLQTAVTYAEPNNIIHPFVARGDPIQTLLTQLPKTPFILRLQQTVSPAARSASRSPLADPLTDREQEVLACLAAGLTNKAIEEKLFISKNTVRTHLKNLYSKLGVNGRSQAVARANELELL